MHPRSWILTSPGAGHSTGQDGRHPISIDVLACEYDPHPPALLTATLFQQPRKRSGTCTFGTAMRGAKQNANGLGDLLLGYGYGTHARLTQELKHARVWNPYSQPVGERIGSRD